MSKTKFIIASLTIIALVLIFGIGYTCCTSSKSNNEDSDFDEEVTSVDKKPLPLNISVFIDLSDRLIRNQTPSQTQRDLEIIDQLSDIFIDDCRTNGGIIGSNNHFQVFFYPTPDNTQISTLSKGLNIDMKKLDIKQKKVELKNMKEQFNKNLSQIYEDAVSAKQWVGCDIWGFFSNKDVDVQCVRKGYRNILVILTDGYLYHVQNKQKIGDAYSYILPQTLSNQNSSLIAKRDGLDDLEVLMLEVNPYTPTQREPMINILEQWFEEMGVKKFAVAVTDLPDRTANFIEVFLENN